MHLCYFVGFRVYVLRFRGFLYTLGSVVQRVFMVDVDREWVGSGCSVGFGQRLLANTVLSLFSVLGLL